MSKVIVIHFATLDGIIQDPDGREGTPQGVQHRRHAPRPPHLGPVRQLVARQR
jgi:hypothetical protein